MTLGCFFIKPVASYTTSIVQRSPLFIVPARVVTQTAAHLRLSSTVSSQIFATDLFAYQTLGGGAATGLVDIFFLYSRASFFTTFRGFKVHTGNSFCRSPQSLDRFFFNYWWSERESSEHYGLFFTSKQDSRNLLLDYTWSVNPFLKFFPSVGFVEVFFDSLSGRLFHQRVSYQI